MIKTNKNPIYRVSVSYVIEILKTSEPIPVELQREFTDWLMSQVKQLGVGTNVEYFAWNGNHLDDIRVEFIISTK